MWNLEKWYRGTYFQGRNRDTDIGNEHVDMPGALRGVGGGKDETNNCEIRTDIYTLPCVKQIASGNLQ